MVKETRAVRVRGQILLLAAAAVALVVRAVLHRQTIRAETVGRGKL